LRRSLRLSAERLEDRCLPAINLLGVATALTGSAEHATQEIAASYETILGRAPDPAGEAVTVAQFQQGVTPQQFDASLAGSDEFVANHGGLGAGWIQGAYSALLNRPVDAPALAAWEGVLAAGGTAGQVAGSLALSLERTDRLVTTEYQQLLGRAPTPGELVGWSAQVSAGLDIRSLEAHLVGSAEYRGQFTSDGGWLIGAYQELLGRAPTDSEMNTWLATGAAAVAAPPAPAPAPGPQTLFTDVAQQQAPTCYFAASLAAVARSGVNLAGRVSYLGNNTFNVPLYNPQVDAFNNVTGFGPVLNVQVYFDGSTNPATDLQIPDNGHIWPVLYQRAYNQAFGASPLNGSSAFAIMTLTGQDNVNLPGANWAFGSKTPTAGDVGQVAAALAQGEAVVADTRSNGALVLDPTTGLISAHSYTVIAADPNFVTLYNPWGVDTDWHLLDTNHDGILSGPESLHSPDGLNGNFNDGLLRVSVAQFAALFNDVVVANRAA
jgi:hypothetical protein